MKRVSFPAGAPPIRYGMVRRDGGEVPVRCSFKHLARSLPLPYGVREHDAPPSFDVATKKEQRP
jgi:hypothetical protein